MLLFPPPFLLPPPLRRERYGIRLNDRQKFDWLRLSRTAGVGPRTFQSLINRFGGAGAALEALPLLARQKQRVIDIPTEKEIEAEMRQAMRLGVRLVASGEEEYPASLLTICGPPPILYLRGEGVCVWDKPMVALVGARNASALGRKMAEKLAHDLSAAGYVVVSGLARGIDTEAHRASLQGGTIAVLAGGLDKIYPPENKVLYDQILENGLVVSEMPLGLSPRGRDFPRRNRLISGLSQGVIVVEAARRSGSLITARMANEQGREVFAVPGSPFDARCEGTNDLLRDGATIITKADDVIQFLQPLAGEEGRRLYLFREPTSDFYADFFEEFSEEGEGDPLSQEEGGRAAIHTEKATKKNHIAAKQEKKTENIPLDEDLEEEAETDLPPKDRLLQLLSFDPVDIDTLIRLSAIPTRELREILTELEVSGHVERHSGNRVARVFL